MTPEQIDRVLPRAATWPPRIYDMTDTDERREACEWVAGIVNAAETPSNTDEDVRASIEWLRSLRQRGVTTVEYYDGVCRQYEGAMRVVGSTDWPPPPHWAIPTQPSPPAPGITYHGRDDER